ncbi:MAG: FHA domain-containing protein [Anaerolineae bacterium]|nr:FHA domain-containing protein [Anaerolineae bacterium]
MTDEGAGKQTWGTARFNDNSAIVIHFRETEVAPVILTPEDEMTMGRYDGTSPNVPTLDLTPFGAYEKGVSRMHAAIRRGDGSLNLVDLGSVNGTFLNGQRLIPNRPHVLRDGDEVKFGKLMCHVYFKALNKPPQIPPPLPPKQ